MPPCCTSSIFMVLATSESALLTLSTRISSMSIEGAARPAGIVSFDAMKPLKRHVAVSGRAVVGVDVSAETAAGADVHGVSEIDLSPKKPSFVTVAVVPEGILRPCLLYTSDAADEEDSVD